MTTRGLAAALGAGVEVGGRLDVGADREHVVEVDGEAGLGGGVDREHHGLAALAELFGAAGLGLDLDVGDALAAAAVDLDQGVGGLGLHVDLEGAEEVLLLLLGDLERLALDEGILGQLGREAEEAAEAAHVELVLGALLLRGVLGEGLGRGLVGVAEQVDDEGALGGQELGLVVGGGLSVLGLRVHVAGELEGADVGDAVVDAELVGALGLDVEEAGEVGLHAAGLAAAGVGEGDVEVLLELGGGGLVAEDDAAGRGGAAAWAAGVRVGGVGGLLGARGEGEGAEAEGADEGQSGRERAEHGGGTLNRGGGAVQRTGCVEAP
jgi:hypothetical protein